MDISTGKEEEEQRQQQQQQQNQKEGSNSSGRPKERKSRRCVAPCACCVLGGRGPPCFHGYDGPYDAFCIATQQKFSAHSEALRRLTACYREVLDELLCDPSKRSDLCPAVDAVNICQQRGDIPITSDFAMFMISTAVDALVDGDPQLPPREGPFLAQMGLFIEKLVEEEQGEMPQFSKESERMRYLFHDTGRIDGGDDVVPYLHERTDCVCLEGKEFCRGCDRVVPKGTLKRCTQCKVACYCSRDCQRGSWERGHKKKCKQIKKSVDMGFLR